MTTELVVPCFGYKNHVTIDRRHGFVRRYTVTHAAAHDGTQLAAVLDRDNTASAVPPRSADLGPCRDGSIASCDRWADTAYRSKDNLAMLARRGLVEHRQRPKPRGKPMAPHVRRGNARRARVRVAVEHVFAVQKRRLRLVIRTVGKARAEARLGLANLVTNMLRLAWFESRPAPA